MRRMIRPAWAVAALVLLTLGACKDGHHGDEHGHSEEERSHENPAEEKHQAREQDPERRPSGVEDEHDGEEGHEDRAHREHGEEGHGDHGEEGHGDHGEEGIVRLSERAIARSGIRLEAARSGGLAGAFHVPAEVQLNPDRVAHVAPLVAGQLLEVRVALGDRVEPEQPIALLRCVELGLARAEYARTRAMVDVAEANFARQERLRTEGISSERDYLEAQLRVSEATAERDAASARLQVFGVRGGRGPDLELKAPLAGLVIERHATRGENVGPDDNLFVVANLTTVWVIGRVYEQHIASLQAGMEATLTLQAFPGRTWTGTVGFVASTLDEETRSLAVRVEIDNADGALRPGLFGTLSIGRGEDGAATVVVVPEAAVQDLRGRAVVFVPEDEPNTFHAVPVVLGLRAAGRIEVLEGLAADTRVVVEGAFVLKSQLLRGELGHGHAH